MLLLREEVPEAKVLRNWAMAEFSNPDRWTTLAKVVPGEVLQRLRGRLPLEDHEWADLAYLIHQFRSPLLNGLLALHPHWYSATVAVGDLPSVRVIAYEPFVRAAPSRLLNDLATAAEDGDPIDGGFNVLVRRMAEAFDLATMQGMPILVAQTINDPWYLVEGYTRCAAMLLASRAGRLAADTSAPIIFGIAPQLPPWNWY